MRLKIVTKNYYHVSRIKCDTNKASNLQIYQTDDYNRVVLETIPDVPSSDYINASHVDVSSFINFLFF